MLVLPNPQLGVLGPSVNKKEEHKGLSAAGSSYRSQFLLGSDIHCPFAHSFIQVVM